MKAVQKMLGHASTAVTLDVYADLFEDDLYAASNALNFKISQKLCPFRVHQLKSTPSR